MIPLNCMFFAMIEEFFMRFAYTTKSPFRHSEFCRTIQSDPIANIKLDTNRIICIIHSYEICLPYILKMHVRGVTP